MNQWGTVWGPEWLTRLFRWVSLIYCSCAAGSLLQYRAGIALTLVVIGVAVAQLRVVHNNLVRFRREDEIRLQRKLQDK